MVVSILAVLSAIAGALVTTAITVASILGTLVAEVIKQNKFVAYLLVTCIVGIDAFIIQQGTQAVFGLPISVTGLIFFPFNLLLGWEIDAMLLFVLFVFGGLFISLGWAYTFVNKR